LCESAQDQIPSKTYELLSFIVFGIKLSAMKSILFLAAIVCSMILGVSAQDWAKAVLDKSPRHGEWVTIKRGDRAIQAYVVYPEVKTKAPVVIVIHEIFGLSDWARTVPDQLAANGYIAIAPDLLSGMGPKGGGTSEFATRDDVVAAVGKLDPDAVTADLNAVADFALKIKSSNGKLAVAGFCWGGSQSFRFATNRQDLAAAFVFYGSGPKDVSTIKAPVYGFYAGNDARIGATIPDTTAAMKTANKKYDPVTYDGAGHGFMRAGMDPTIAPNETDTQKAAREANKKARDDAWKRWLELLKTI